MANPQVTTHVTTHHCVLRARDKQVLEHEVERLNSRLRHFAPDLVHLDLTIERHDARDLYEGSVRLRIGAHALPSKRNLEPTLDALLRKAFTDIETQLARYKARLRREPAIHRASRAKRDVRSVA